MKRSYKDANPTNWDIIVKFNKPLSKNYVVHGKFDGMNFVNAIKYGLINDFINGYVSLNEKYDIINIQGDDEKYNYELYTSDKHNYFPIGIMLKGQIQYNVICNIKNKSIIIYITNIDDMLKQMMFFKRLSIKKIEER